MCRINWSEAVQYVLLERIEILHSESVFIGRCEVGRDVPFAPKDTKDRSRYFEELRCLSCL